MPSVAPVIRIVLCGWVIGRLADDMHSLFDIELV